MNYLNKLHSQNCSWTILKESDDITDSDEKPLAFLQGTEEIMIISVVWIFFYSSENHFLISTWEELFSSFELDSYFTLQKSERRRNWNSLTFLDYWGASQIFQHCGYEWQASSLGHLPWAYRSAAVPRTTVQTPEIWKPRWHLSEFDITFALNM